MEDNVKWLNTHSHTTSKQLHRTKLRHSVIKHSWELVSCCCCFVWRFGCEPQGDCHLGGLRASQACHLAPHHVGQQDDLWSGMLLHLFQTSAANNKLFLSAVKEVVQVSINLGIQVRKRPNQHKTEHGNCCVVVLSCSPSSAPPQPLPWSVSCHWQP